MKKYLDQIRWIGEPSLAAPEDYEKAREVFVSHLAKRPELLAVYQQGEPTILGISDLDLVCVVEDRLTKSRPEEFSARPLFGAGHVAFRGEPRIVPKSVFHHLQEAFPLPRLRPIHGKVLMQEVYTEKEAAILSVIHTVDQLGFHALRYARLLGETELSIRAVLAFLNNLVSCLKVLQTVTGKITTPHFIEEVALLRRDWFKNSPDRMSCLKVLLARVGEVLGEAIFTVDQFIRDQGWVTVSREKSAFLTTGDGGAVVFASLEGVSPVEWTSRLLEWNLLPGRWRARATWRSPLVVLPFSFGVQLSAYAQEGRGPMTETLRRSFGKHLLRTEKVDPFYHYWLRRRIAVLDRQAEFLAENGFNFSGLFMTVSDPPHRTQSVPGGFVRRAKHTARNAVLSLIRPLRIKRTVGRWTVMHGRRPSASVSQKIPTVLFVTPSHRGNRGDDAMYNVTRSAFAKEFGPIRTVTLIHRELTPEEVRQADLNQPTDVLLSLTGLLKSGYPIVEAVARGAGGIATRLSRIANLVLPSHRRFRISEIRSTVQAITYGGWILLNAFFLKTFGKTWCLPSQADRILKAIQQADLLYMVGAGAMNSLYAAEGLYHRALVILAGRIFGKRSVLSGQTVGPLTRPFDRWFARVALNRAEVITLRDHGISREVLRQIGVVCPKILDVADDAWALEAVPAEAVEAALRQEDLFPHSHTPWIGVTARFVATSSFSEDRLRDLFAEAFDQAVERFNAAIVFVPMFVNQDPAKDDRVEAKRIIGRMRHRERSFIVRGDHTPSVIKGILGRMDLVIGTRYHGVLFTLSTARPAIAVSVSDYYTMKMMGVMRPMGQSHHVLPLEGLTADQLVEHMGTLLHETPSTLMKSLEERARPMRQTVLAAVPLAVQLLRQRRFEARHIVSQPWKTSPEIHARTEREFIALDRSQWENDTERQKRVAARISHLIHHAVTQVPFYRERWNGSVCRGENLEGFELLKRLPIISKRDLARVFPQGCVAEKVDRSRFHLAFTSGSTGEAFRFYRDIAGMPMRIACRRLADRWAGIQPGDRLVWIGAPFHKSERRVGEWFKVMLGQEPPRFISVFDLSARTVPFHLARITRAPVSYVLAGYTSALLVMAEEIERQGLKVVRRPRCVIATAETMSTAQRRLIEQAFGTGTINQYASLEFGTVGFSCPDVPDLMHLNPEWYVCEILREDGSPADSGEVGHIVITDLTNEAMPFIRYDTGDLVRVSEPCRCGRSWPTIAHIEGRTSDRITTRSGRIVFSSMIDHLLQIQHDYTPHLVEYQAVRRGDSELQFLYVPTSKWTPQIGASLEHDLQSFFGKDFTVGAKAVSEIPREPSGKRLLVKSIEV
ncbi:MAG: polysaccharide pyruvyl transferase family protein [Candidatus Omnitrophica bacterium]|nr:polysaccharide pyruvyl transferase family protein [Candidatus Omnitrophota bacterium]